MQHLIGESGYRAEKFTTLTVKQKYWSWFKNTGRGFAISTDDGSNLFVVDTKAMGKHRVIEDKNGKPLYNLERHWASKERAWVLKVGDEVLLTVGYSWLHRGISMDVSFGQSTTPSDLKVKGTDKWGETLNITTGETAIATMRCTSMKPGIVSALKVSPPTWEVSVSEGVDLALISVLAVCVSDAFSECRALML